MNALLRILVATLLFVGGCAAGRRPLPPGYIPEAASVSEADLQFGHDVFSEISQRYPIDRNDAHIERVRNIVDRLTKAVDARQDPWHVYVLVDPSFKNAAATRGNYVFVWTGMFDVVNRDEELATVLAHEIGHVLAGHTAGSPQEEVNSMIAGVSGEIVGQIVSAQGGVAGVFGDLAGMLVEEGIKAFIVNPQSQSRELEADGIGIMVMAKAGYDPDIALEFWKKLKNVPELSTTGALAVLSSHPSTDERIKNLGKLLPDAELYYQASLRTVRKELSTKARVATPASKTKTQRIFKVLAEYADVHEGPSAKSPVIASLPKGFRVEGQTFTVGWIKSSSPYAGYVRAKDLN